MDASEKDNTQMLELILTGLGGQENILNMECCSTRLRVRVADLAQVDKSLLGRTGALSVFDHKGVVHVAYGIRSAQIMKDLETYLSKQS